MKALIAIATVYFSLLAFAEGTNDVFDIKTFLGYGFGDDISTVGRQGSFKLEKPFRIFDGGQAFKTKMNRVYLIRMTKDIGDYSDDSYREEAEKMKMLFENKYNIKFSKRVLTVKNGSWNIYKYENANVRILIDYPHDSSNVRRIELSVRSNRQEREDNFEFSQKSKKFTLPDNQGVDML